MDASNLMYSIRVQAVAVTGCNMGGCASCGGPRYKRPGNGSKTATTPTPATTLRLPKKRVRPIFRNGRFVINPPEPTDEG